MANTDSDVKNEMTCILYLKGDTSKGGELEVNNEKTYAFMNNALFCMKSHLRHKTIIVNYGESTRLAINGDGQLMIRDMENVLINGVMTYKDPVAFRFFENVEIPFRDAGEYKVDCSYKRSR